MCWSESLEINNQEKEKTPFSPKEPYALQKYAKTEAFSLYFHRFCFTLLRNHFDNHGKTRISYSLRAS